MKSTARLVCEKCLSHLKNAFNQCKYGISIDLLKILLSNSELNIV